MTESVVVASSNGRGGPPLEPGVRFGAGRRPEQATRVSFEDWEGPLGLLLSLIEARRLDVLSVPLGALAEAYLDALAGLEDDRIGNIATFKYQPTPAEIDNKIFETMTMALLQGTKEQAQAITVDVFVVNQPPALTPGSGIFSSPRCRPYGVVQYGSDGATGSVRFDVGLGRRFTVGGNYVSLLLGMDQPPGWTTTNRNAGQMILGASLAFFAAPTAAPVMLTSYLDTSLAALGTQTVPVPAPTAPMRWRCAACRWCGCPSARGARTRSACT